MGETKQKYFEEVSQLKQQMFSQKTVFEKKYRALENELSQKKFIITKYEE